MGEAGQEGQFRSAIQQELGIPGEQQTLRDLSRKLTAQRLGLGSAINRAELEAIGTGETQQFFGGKEARIRRESAIDTNTTAAQMLGVQGNIEAAISLADRAVDAKFEPLKRELEVAQFNLGRADKYMTGAEKKLAAAKKQELDFQLDELENERTLEKDRTSGIFGVAERAQQNGAPSSLIQQITAAKTPEEALALAGGYGVSISDRLAQAKFAASNLPADVQQAASGSAAQISLIDDLLDNKIGFKAAVGPRKIQRREGGSLLKIAQGAKGKRQDFSGTLKQLTGQLTIDSLLQAKAQGATFGALSETELNILANAATKISQWEVIDKKTKLGTGKFAAPEAAVEKELKKIQDLAKKDYLIKTGQEYVDPSFTSEEDFVDALTGSPYAGLAQ